MRRATILFSFFILVSLAICTTLIFTKPTLLSQAFQLQLTTLLLHVCGAILFLLAIKGFRESFQKAYRFLSAGASMLLVGVIIIYLLMYLGVYEQPWVVRSGIQEISFIFMSVCFYIGIRTFAELFLAQSWLTKPKKVFLTALVAGIGAGITSHLLWRGPFSDFVIGLRFGNLLLFFLGAILSYQVWRVISPFYKKAFMWFTIFFAFTLFNTICGFLQGIGWIDWFAEISIILYLIAGLLLSITALQFNRVAYTESHAKFSLSDKTVVKATKTSVDIIIFLARFASNQSPIDPLLDPLRLITASSTYQGKPNPTEQQAFGAVYLQLEDYLVNKEPLRKFEQKKLRQMVELQFKDSVDEPFFWEKIASAAAPQIPHKI